jgi:2-polyprenyl-3-methyl-5-hydroxy-6-metoxy-1,4-benzoquinol methylase
VDADYAAAYPALYARHWWWRVREQILLRKIKALLRDVPDARILDVGCGAALFFDALEPFGRVEGVESDGAAVAHSGRWRDHIVAAGLDDDFVPAAPYDLILMLDVLEHVVAPEQVLCRAGRLLRPNGRILITVPAFTWLWTSHDEMNHHVARYSRAALRRVVAASGLATVESRYLFQSLVLPKLIVRAAEGAYSRARHVPTVPAPAINALIQSWFRLEHAALGWLPFGGSVLAIARREASCPGQR